MTKIRALLPGLAFASFCMADISGIVTDTGGVLPVSGAVVQLENGGQTTTTGTDGRFTLAAVSIIPGRSRLMANGLSASVSGTMLKLTIVERSAVEVAMFDLTGKALATVRRSFDAGSHSISLPCHAAGIYLYKIKCGNRVMVLKGNALRGVSYGSAVSLYGSSSRFIAQQDTGSEVIVQDTGRKVINDVMAVIKEGYLNYRVVAYNPDTGGVAIKMIACAGTLTDADGNIYQTVRIGSQEWLAENLRVTKYNDGSAITEITGNATWDSCAFTNIPAYCYYENTSSADSIRKFGALYNWYAVNDKKLAPAGWHVPSDSEWTVLEKYMGLNGYNWDSTRAAPKDNKIAKSMAVKADWHTYATKGTIGGDLTKNNSSGFSALPCGYRLYNSTFFGLGGLGSWWSATAYDATDAWYRHLSFDYDDLSRYYYFKSCGYSVRLLKD